MDADRIVVRIPDLFVSFLRDEPILNANYHKVRSISEEAVAHACRVNPRVAKAISACDFSYFAAVMTPDADEHSFRTICDWGNWIFPFDDIFDDGQLRDNHEAAQELLDQLLNCFQNFEKDCAALRPPIVRFHDCLWDRIRSAPVEIRNRYASGMRDYCSGALEQVKQAEDGYVEDVEHMLSVRRRSVCVSTLFALVEYGQGLEIPAYVFDHPTLKAIEIHGIEMTLLHNDLLSYRKEEAEGVTHNTVAASRMWPGRSAQEAVDLVGRMINERHQRLDEAIKSLPDWGDIINKEVERYVEGVKNTVRANLYWSFMSARFMSEEVKQRIKRTGEVDVLAHPPWLTRGALSKTPSSESLCLTHVLRSFGSICRTTGLWVQKTLFSMTFLSMFVWRKHLQGRR